MRQAAVQVSHLSKRFELGESAVTLREALTRLVRWSPRRGQDERTLWALSDVSFEVEEGEAVGVIGRNGAGKSTLLKVLSRITEPTSGRAELLGRVASLLEVGTGFHPELTGRENIYLNGAILGMSRAEVARKFDQIVEFAGVERFVDTPVKHYSSGMFLRLGFAVAAHLEPEILIVDEVLAVGDQEFQRRCLTKMDDVSRSGRTVLFVSHQLNAVRSLCTRTLWLDAGRVKQFGPTAEVVAAYEVAASSGGAEAPGVHEQVRFNGWRLAAADAHVLHEALDPVHATFSLKVLKPLVAASAAVSLATDEGQVAGAWDLPLGDLAEGTFELTLDLPFLPLHPGPYQWQIGLYAGRSLVEAWYALPHLVIASTPVAPARTGRYAAVLNVPAKHGCRRLT